jgi:mono/diheme cytochrome c family protein
MRPLRAVSRGLFEKCGWRQAAAGAVEALMRVVIIVAFAAAMMAAPKMAAAQDAAKGQQLYAAQKCSMCHQVAGKGNKLSVLDGVGAKLTAAQIKEWIVEPDAAAKKANSTKKPVMPKTYAKLPPADIDSLVAYMQSLK